MTEQERKEAVKLLEKIENEFWSKDGIKWSRVETVDILPLIQQARVLLDKPDEQPRELTPEQKHFLEAKIAEPESSEFVKTIRDYIADFIYAEQHGIAMQNKPRCLEKDLIEVCDRLEAAEKHYGICEDCGSLVVWGKSTVPCAKCGISNMRIINLEVEWAKQYTEIKQLKDEIKNNLTVRNAARKLSQCFPEKDGKEGVKFDIPRYVIDELENALEKITTDDTQVDALIHKAYIQGRTKGFETGKRHADDLESKIIKIEAKYKSLAIHSEQLESHLTEAKAENKRLEILNEDMKGK